MAGFAETAKEAFSYLEEKYGFVLELCSDEKWGGQLVYRNIEDGIGIRLVYEFASAFVFVFVYRLMHGKMIENHLPITEKSKITCFDFNDMLDDAHKMKPAYEYGDKSRFYEEKKGLRDYVAEFANRLRIYGDDILRGNLSRLPHIEKIIKARARCLHNRH